MKRLVKLVALLIIACGCRTLDYEAQYVQVVPRVSKQCKPLGMVNVDWAWWGTTTETTNVMRNQTAELGGNALLLKGDAVGFAYRCPRLD